MQHGTPHAPDEDSPERHALAPTAHPYRPLPTDLHLALRHLEGEHGIPREDAPRDRGALTLLHSRRHADDATPRVIAGGSHERPESRPAPVGGDDPVLAVPAFHGRAERCLRVLEDALDALRAVDPTGARSAAAAVVRRMEARA